VQCIPISLHTVSVFVQARMASCPTLHRSWRQADGHSHEPHNEEGFMCGDLLTAPEGLVQQDCMHSLSRSVTESVAGVDLTILRLRCKELRLVQEETGVQILEVAGLYGCTVLVTGAEAAVQLAWPQVVKLLVPISSCETDQSSRAATPAEDLPMLPAGMQAIQSFCPPPGLSMPTGAVLRQTSVRTGAVNSQTSVQTHLQPEPGMHLAPSQTLSEISRASDVNEMKQESAAKEGMGLLTPRATSPSDDGFSGLHKPDGKPDGSLIGKDDIESEQSPNSASSATSKRKRRQEKKRAQKVAAAAEEAEIEAAAIESSLTPMKFILPAPLPLEGVKSSKKPIQILSNVGYAHGDRLGKSPPTFTARNFSLSQASRALVIGAKGAGKTALAMLLANRMPPTTGTVRRVEGLRVAHLSQQSLTELDSHREMCAERCCAWLSTNAWLQVTEPKIDDFEHLGMRSPAGPDGASWREHLRAFGFDLNSLRGMKVSSLSIAAKASLLIAASFWPRPQIVVLDDPVNWLDSIATQALLEALATFKGGAVVTTLSKHQHWFEALATEKWMLRGGQLCCADSLPEKAAPAPSQVERTKIEQELKHLASLTRQKDKMTEEQMNKAIQRLESLRTMLLG